MPLGTILHVAHRAAIGQDLVLLDASRGAAAALAYVYGMQNLGRLCLDFCKVGCHSKVVDNEKGRYDSTKNNSSSRVVV